MELDDDGKKAHNGLTWLDSFDLMENLSAALWVEHGVTPWTPTLDRNIRALEELGIGPLPIRPTVVS